MRGNCDVCCSKVGRAVARSLLDADQSVRAVVRDAAKGSAGSAWASRGCEVATADLDNVAPLAAAFTGVGGVFAMLLREHWRISLAAHDSSDQQEGRTPTIVISRAHTAGGRATAGNPRDLL
jgi:NmrA-like family protein